MKYFRPENLIEYNRLKYSEVKIGDVVGIHNKREATWIKVIDKSYDSRKLIKGIVQTYSVFHTAWTKGDEIIVHVKYISQNIKELGKSTQKNK